MSASGPSGPLVFDEELKLVEFGPNVLLTNRLKMQLQPFGCKRACAYNTSEL